MVPCGHGNGFDGQFCCLGRFFSVAKACTCVGAHLCGIASVDAVACSRSGGSKPSCAACAEWHSAASSRPPTPTPAAIGNGAAPGATLRARSGRSVRGRGGDSPCTTCGWEGRGRRIAIDRLCSLRPGPHRGIWAKGHWRSSSRRVCVRRLACLLASVWPLEDLLYVIGDR